MNLILSAQGLRKVIKAQDLLHGKFEKLLWDVPHLEMPAPGLYVLAGKNGCGKSTLLRALLGLIQPDKGSISWFGRTSFSSREIGYLPEFPILPPAVRVRFWLSCLLNAKPADLVRLDAELERYPALSIKEILNVPANRLSKGQQQRVQLWAAMAQNPQGVVLDEPFSGLDPWARVELAEFLLHLLSEGRFVLMATHELPLNLRKECRSTWLVENATVNVREGCIVPE